MAQRRIIPEATYTVGTYGPYELQALPGNSTGFALTFTRVNWPAGNVLRIVTEWSRNNRDTWLPIRETTFVGGTLLRRDGQPVVTCGLTQTWPDALGETLRGTDIRITAYVLADLTTAITLEAI